MPASSHNLDAHTETDLITRLRQGDPSAFETLFRQHSPSVLRFAQSFTLDQDIAEDIMQEVFAWVWTHRTTFSPPDNLLAYLLGAVRNAVLHRARTERSRTSETTRALILGEISDSGNALRSIDDIIEDRDSTALVWRVVEGLPEPRRSIFFLRWRHGLDWEDIARIVEISVGAAKTQHSRTLMVIRERLPKTFLG